MTMSNSSISIAFARTTLDYAISFFFFSPTMVLGPRKDIVCRDIQSQWLFAVMCCSADLIVISDPLS